MWLPSPFLLRPLFILLPLCQFSCFVISLGPWSITSALLPFVLPCNTTPQANPRFWGLWTYLAPGEGTSIKLFWFYFWHSNLNYGWLYSIISRYFLFILIVRHDILAYPHKMVGLTIPVCIVFEQEVYMFHSQIPRFWLTSWIFEILEAWIWLINVNINCKLSWLSWWNTETHIVTIIIDV